MEERRIFARINIKIPLKFLNPTDDKIGEAQTVNISANGVGFITKEDLAPKTPLDLWLYIPDHHAPLHVVGEVVWSQKLSDNMSRRVGVQLEDERLMGLGRAWLYKDTHPDKI